MSKKNSNKKNTCKKHAENGVSLDVNTVKHAVIEQDDHVQTGNVDLPFIICILDAASCLNKLDDLLPHPGSHFKCNAGPLWIL